MAYQIVMYGDHGGELNRTPLVPYSELKEAFVEMINDTELSVGDKFVIASDEK